MKRALFTAFTVFVICVFVSREAATWVSTRMRKKVSSALVVSTPTTFTNCGYGGLTLSNRNRTITDSDVNSSAYSVHSMSSGKRYFEVTLTNYVQSLMGVTCAAVPKCTVTINAGEAGMA